MLINTMSYGGDMHSLLLLALFLPLAGFIGLASSALFVGRRLAGVIGCATIFIAFMCFLVVQTERWQLGLQPESWMLMEWISVSGIDANFTLEIDSLSLLMTLVVTGVGFLIHVYSIGYMSHDADYARYFAFMNLFVFCMLVLVLAGDLLMLFIGWEGVGLSSYLLIGFWYQKPSAAQAATKAFVVNRIGDLGLLLGILLTFHTFGTSNIREVIEKASSTFAVGAPLITIMTLLYFVGAIGKSAQLPLYTWLPDAMEGPTPVSALIHAATMVTAGVYLVVRMHPVFALAPDTLYFIAIIGGATALFAALCAVGQTDLKRVLAYSTVSQLGYMFLACGVGAFYAAMFHLTVHAFVKGLLFLAAGNIIHMTHDNTDMRQMGGLAKYFPWTKWLLLIGVLALSGVPPLSAFFSKDMILEEGAKAGFHVLYAVGLVTAVITAFYLTRAYCLTFLGASRDSAGYNADAGEAPKVMVLPVSILGVLSIVGGFLGFCLCTSPLLASFLSEEHIHIPVESFSLSFLLAPETLLSVAGAILGIASAAYIYTHFADKPIRLLKNSFYVDDLYRKTVVTPAKALGNFVAHFLEPKLFNGSIHVAVKGAQGTAALMQRIQSGQIRSYVAWMLVGAAGLIVYFIY